MPNWCEGNIRFRGTKENIKQFLLNEVISCKMGKDFETIEEKPIVKDDCEYQLILEKQGKGSWFYVKGTNRNFFEGDSIEVWFNEDDEYDGEIIVCIDNFKVAWSFDKCDAWVDFAQKYKFDVKMVGWDSGMQFSQIMTIMRDGVRHSTVHEYEDTADWMWNCPQPNNGG